MEQMTQSLKYTAVCLPLSSAHQQILPHPCASAKFLSRESSTSLVDDGKYEVFVLQEISLWSAKCCNKAEAGLWGQRSTPCCVCDTPDFALWDNWQIKDRRKIKIMLLFKTFPHKSLFPKQQHDLICLFQLTWANSYKNYPAAIHLRLKSHLMEWFDIFENSLIWLFVKSWTRRLITVSCLYAKYEATSSQLL